MKKKIFMGVMLISALGLCACGSQNNKEEASSNENISDEAKTAAQSENTSDDTENATEGENVSDEIQVETTRVCVSGKDGEISIEVPDDWTYEICEEGSDKLISGMDYGIAIKPKDASEQEKVEIGSGFVGWCGTGMEKETVPLAGVDADILYYDGSTVWEGICLSGDLEDINAVNYAVQGEWTKEQYDEAIDIVGTIEYKSKK